MYEPTTGDILLGGVNLRLTRVRDIRSRVAVVTQDVHLVSGTVRDNITLFDRNVPDGLLFRILETLGMKEWSDRLPRGLDTTVSPGELSAGEAQLLALARAFIRDPDLVILDEASSRLDPATESLLDRAIDRLLAGRTAVIIAHRLATVDQVDEIMVLDQGRIVEHGERATLAALPETRFAQMRSRGIREVLQ
jgi:ATP-binding cassette subfamily B protein